MRAVAAASMLSGSASPAWPRRRSSRSCRNCGLPAERSAASASTCGGAGAASVSAPRARAPRAGVERRRAQARRPAARPARRSRRRRVAARGHDEPGAAGQRVDGARSRLRRRGVHVVRLLELEQRRAVEHRAQQPQHGPRAGARAELGLRRATSGVRRDAHAERDGEQRQPRQQRRLARLHRPRAAAQHGLRLVVQASPSSWTQQLAPDA